MLIRWLESSTAGRTVTFEIPADGADDHPFKGYSAGKNGQRFIVVAVPIADDEQPDEQAVANAKKAKPKPFLERPRSQQAGILLGDAQFQRFVAMDALDPTNRRESADAFLKRKLGINSKRELDSEPGASAWDRLVSAYYAGTGQMAEIR